MFVKQGVGSVCLGQLILAYWILQPALLRRSGELADPQGRQDGDTVLGELAHQRVEPFLGDSPGTDRLPRGGEPYSLVRAAGYAYESREAPVTQLE